jgi:hypothetical protein
MVFMSLLSDFSSLSNGSLILARFLRGLAEGDREGRFVGVDDAAVGELISMSLDIMR